jgi:glutathione S-transferase
MDSVAIAAYLESTHTSPPIHPNAPEVAAVEKAVAAAFGPIAPLIVSGIPRNLLNGSSEEHFEKGFRAGVGMSTEEFGQTVSKEECLTTAKEPWLELAGMLKRNGGPFVRGEQGE